MREPKGPLVFKITQESDGGFVAACMTEGIVTQGDTWQELVYMVKDAVRAYFFDSAPPRTICLRFRRRKELIELK